MRSASPFIRFVNQFTEFEFVQNTSLITLTASQTQVLLSGVAHQVIIDTFLFLQVACTIVNSSASPLEDIILRNNGTAAMQYHSAGLEPLLQDTNVPANSARRYNGLFMLKCTSPGTYIFRVDGSSVPSGAIINPTELRCDIYIFK